MSKSTRQLVVISGYYGFGNLGDEAILEELTEELKQLIPPNDVVVLSANPARTAELLNVQAHPRMDMAGLVDILKRTKLFVSGGGGLFQNTRSVGSILYYGCQMLLAKIMGAKVMVYAQGLGPLRGNIARHMTRQAMASADVIAVRDTKSKAMLDEWGIRSLQTADPVWCLAHKQLPQDIEQQLSTITKTAESDSTKIIALSLRSFADFTDQHLHKLVKAMAQTVPADTHVVLLPLQEEQDRQLLLEFQKLYKATGRSSTLIDTSSLHAPSQWISLFERCTFVVGMRLHALIMSIKAGVPVVGIAYDPKVSQLLTDFEQPALILTKEEEGSDWALTLNSAFNDRERLSQQAMRKAEGAKKLACQNFDLLAKILGCTEA